MQTALDAAGGAYARYDYTHRTHGGHVSRTIGAAAERLAGGAASPAQRETAGIVYHIYEGSGTTTVGEQRLTWTKGDTFCIPAWAPYRHEASSDTYLFRFDDRPVLEAIGAYRTQADLAGTGIVS